MRKKLRSRRGETLVEALVSVLLVSIVSAALVVMVLSASQMNKAASQKDSELYNAISAAETNTVSEGLGGPATEDNLAGETGTVTVTVGSSSVTKQVTFYGSKDETIFSYQENRGAGG